MPFNEAKRVEIRGLALEIARKHGYDVNPPEFIAGIEKSLKETKAAGLSNILMTTGGRRYKHQAMEKAGIGDYFDEIVDREETYYAKEQGLYYPLSQAQSDAFADRTTQRHGHLPEGRQQRARLQSWRYLSGGNSSRASDRALLQRRGDAQGGASLRC